VLADRDVVETPPATAGAVSNLVPLPEVLSEIAASGVGSKTVEKMYDRVIGALGPELSILSDVPVEDIARAESSVLAEAITRLRAGKVIREAGYDGEYGVIKLFADGELKGLGGLLFDAPAARRAPPPPERGRSTAKQSGGGLLEPAADPHPAPSAPTPDQVPGRLSPLQGEVSTELGAGILVLLDSDQRRAAEIVTGPLLIVAGPGAGKTRTLTHRIAYLIDERGIAPEHCLAVTFTRRAAGEMRERLIQLIGGRAEAVAVHTFHSLGLAILRAHPEAAGLHRDFRIASEEERIAMLVETMGVSQSKAETLLRTISKAKRAQGPMDVDDARAVEAYGRAMSLHNWIDFDDCVGLALRALIDRADLVAQYRDQFRFTSADEFQDIDEQQYRLIAQLAPPSGNLCVIGDPDQAIYGFRGADASCFARFRREYAPQTVALRRNYRSSGTIVTASAQILGNEAAAATVRQMHERIAIHAAPTDKAEAEFVVQTIEGLIGGHNFFSIDSGRFGDGRTDLSFSDFAVLYRTDAQSAPLIEALTRSGIPFRKSGKLVDAEDRVALDAAPPETRGDHVSLLTLHAAKGLEFRVVFIVGLEDGILPLRFGPEEPSAEERRLFYVGMTRAKDRLILTRATQRRWRGRVQSLPPSPFLAAIESELLKHQRNGGLRAKPENRQLSLF
jgi:DNA helicase-2/ATP-dependent DNA helicase PcrA